MNEVMVGELSEFAEGGYRVLRVDSFEFGIFRQGDGLVAYENHCPHDGGPVCQGKVIPRVEEELAPDQTSRGLRFSNKRNIVCPWHGWEFDIDTGRHCGDPKYRLRPLDVKVRDNPISVSLPPTASAAASCGDTRWLALPGLAMRKFFHTSIIVRPDSGNAAPADLRGKRIGVPEYQQTWAIWSRGVLQHEFGVHARDIEWFMERNPEKSHGGATGFSPPGVRLHYIPPNTNIGEMLVRGELDGALLYLVHPNLIDRSTLDVSGVTRHLFPYPAAEGRRFYAKTGLFPINHTVVVRRSLLERHPWVPLNLYSAVVAAT